MADKMVKFTPIRGTEEHLNHQTIVDGQILFATDSGKIFTDVSGRRILLGNNGVALFYANDPAPVQMIETEEQGTLFSLNKSYVENIENCHVNDLILNKPDGCFYQVLAIGESVVSCQQLAVSGSGGGGGGGGTADITLSAEGISYLGYTYAYNQNFNIKFTPKTELTTYVGLRFDIRTSDSDTWTTIKRVQSHRQNTVYNLNAAEFPLNDNFSLRVTINAEDRTKDFTFNDLNTFDISIEKVSTNYTPIILPDDVSGRLSISYIPHSATNVPTYLHVYIDDVEDTTIEGINEPLNPAVLHQVNRLSIKRQTHGTHVIELALSANVNDSDVYTQRIKYSGAWADRDNMTPIIWTGNYNSEVINYETAYIPFMVFDLDAYNNNRAAQVILQKNGAQVGQMDIVYSNDTWAIWDITELYEVGENLFSIICGGSKLDINITVTEKGQRKLYVIPDNLLQNFTASGRSNQEIASNRSKWIGRDSQNQEFNATLSKFNWQNNGWRRDTVINGEIDSGSYLSLTNGASVTFPQLGGQDGIYLNEQVDYTIEIRFRVRNVQKYSTLISKQPKYYYAIDGVEQEEPASMSYIESHGYDLIYEYGTPKMATDDEGTTIYETEQGVLCKWLNGLDYGLVIGSQEAYFRTSKNIISVRYKENEVINLSCVISKTNNLALLYLNGILSGANSLPQTSFQIQSPFTFNSEYCDVDLYRFRIYNIGLSMPEIIRNYLADLHNRDLYDQNQLAEDNNPTLLSYNQLVDYNTNHPESLTMPYATWKILSQEERLPSYKGNNQHCVINFVNPALDLALDDPNNTEVDEWYYYTHCPSYEAYYVDINVQGTSSQGYPRRNFKTKFKDTTKKAADGETALGYWVYTKGSLAGKSLNKDWTVTDKDGVEHKLTKYFHMDNTYIGTNKFTWKIDYMESSGTYNTGFANLMGNLEHPLYSKHPLEDLGLTANGMRTSVYGFPILVFQEFDNARHNYSTPDGYHPFEYIGRYNMNLDKSSNEYYGFEQKQEQPYVDEPWTEYETVPVVDGEGNPQLDGEGNPVTEKRVKAEHQHPYIKDVAECWELRNNQGTWCSFKFPSAAAREVGFAWPQTGDSECVEMVRHFEYRYSAKDDDIDEIGPLEDGGYTKQSDKAQSSLFLRKTYYNLERLFYWLDSTDATTATNGTIKIYEPVKDSQGLVTIQVTELESKDYNTATDYTNVEGAYATSVVNPLGGYITTFTKDTAAYRKEKFKAEFEYHLDKEYCLLYFIMTELLLCYDSRGKNMMLASFGPRTAYDSNDPNKNEYIWYPTFYDIDTQLGLNNSGAYLWDYDADVTQDHLFSTPTSVLWTNFYEQFYGDIVKKYQDLRNGNLTYQNIIGAYECDGEVFNSYAMRGARPIIAIGLDSYYKYIAPAKTGYQTQKGDIVVDSDYQYAYCAQGDKKLTTELLLRNRLNYIDSQWLAGEYGLAQSYAGIRVRNNANAANTSDKYLTVARDGFIQAEYPVPFFDSQPGYKLKPFLKQYVTYYIDQGAMPAVKYNGEADGVRTYVAPDTIEAFKTTVGQNQQINRIPGADYLSSLGDLSISYLDELFLNAAPKLLDLILGSDIPGYKNGLLHMTASGSSPLNLNDAAYIINDNEKIPNVNAKPLLKKVILSNLNAFDIAVDISGSPKMQEFRALNTQIPQVIFADGAPLHTIHLPNTITAFSLIEDAELSTILTRKPQLYRLNNAEGVAPTINDLEVVDSAYNGLYLEGITDYQVANKDTGHTLYELSIKGGKLGYNSYIILNNLVELKRNAIQHNMLAADLHNVHWTPYTVVEYGEPYDENITYYYATDHSTFVEYTYVNDNTWKSDTLNELIYTYDDTAPKDTITSLDLLEEFITYANNNSNQFTNSGKRSGTVPSITGDLFVNNSDDPEDLIDEVELTTVFKVKYPDLTIKAAHVKTANITKYIQVLDSGKFDVFELIRTNDAYPSAPSNSLHIPTKANYDFLGWSLSPNASPIITYDNRLKEYTNLEVLETYNFDSNQTFTLYAYFETHKYDIIFKDSDGSVLQLGNEPVYNFEGEEVSLMAAAGTHLSMPLKLPYKPIEDTDENFYKAYAFSGFSIGNSTEIIDINNYIVSRSVTFTPHFELIDDIRTVVYPELFTVEEDSYDDRSLGLYDGLQDVNQNINGWKLIPKDPASLRGKITLPNTMTVNGITKPVISITGFSQHIGLNSPTEDEIIARDLTHVFLQDKENFYLRQVCADCFNYCTNLHYFDFSDSLRFIDDRAFRGCSLQPNPVVDPTRFRIGNNVARVGQFAFNNGLQNRTNLFILEISHIVNILGQNSFSRLNKINTTKENRQLEIAPNGEFDQGTTSRLRFCPPGSSVEGSWFTQNAPQTFGIVTARIYHTSNYLRIKGDEETGRQTFYYHGPDGTEAEYTDAQIYDLFGADTQTSMHLFIYGTEWDPGNV